MRFLDIIGQQVYYEVYGHNMAWLHQRVHKSHDVGEISYANSRCSVEELQALIL